MSKIKNKKELMAYVGAKDEDHLQKIMFTNTDCGIVAGFSEERIRTEERLYVVKMKPAKIRLPKKGERVAWEITHYHQASSPQLSHLDSQMPYGLGEYLLAYPMGGISAPVNPVEGTRAYMGQDLFKKEETREEFSWGSSREAVEGLRALKDSNITKLTFRGSHAYLTIKVPEHIYGPVFFAGGYCEGVEFEMETHYLNFPMTKEELWKVVDKADKEGVNMWRQTHGCEGCFPDGSMDEWGTAFKKGSLGGPIDPDCASCSGEGITL
jgi:hypothetical protein